MDIRKWLTIKKSATNKDGHSAGAVTLQKPDTVSSFVDSSKETGKSIDVTTKLATAAGTNPAITVPSLPPSPSHFPPPPQLPGLRNRMAVVHLSAALLPS